MTLLADKIEAWVCSYLQEQDLYLVDVEQKKNKITVFVDSDGSITIDQCVKLSRHLEPFLDEDSEIPADYNLEVSSPGMENPLKKPRQYKKRIGQQLKVITDEGQMLLGQLLSADEQQISIKESSKPEPLSIPFSKIKSSKIQFSFK